MAAAASTTDPSSIDTHPRNTADIRPAPSGASLQDQCEQYVRQLAQIMEKGDAASKMLYTTLLNTVGPLFPDALLENVRAMDDRKTEGPVPLRLAS